SSRRFCDRCSWRFCKTRWLQPAATIVAILLLGVLIGRGIRREPPPLIIQRTAPVQRSSTTPPPTTTEETYICGARTKKGTPCSRRVRGPVRCWQHKGAAAMLPPDKLIVKEH